MAPGKQNACECCNILVQNVLHGADLTCIDTTRRLSRRKRLLIPVFIISLLVEGEIHMKAKEKIYSLSEPPFPPATAISCQTSVA